MSRFPMLKEIGGLRALVVGGGPVAVRRAKTLAQFGAQVRIVAPGLSEECDGARIEWIPRKVQPEDLDGVDILVAATDDAALNRRIADFCRSHGAEVNIADALDESSFHFPAILQREGMTIAVSTGEAGPLAAKYVRSRIEKALPEDFDSVLDCMTRARALAKTHISEQKVREQVLRDVFSRCIEGNIPDAKVLERMIRLYSST